MARPTEFIKGCFDRFSIALSTWGYEVVEDYDTVDDVGHRVAKPLDYVKPVFLGDIVTAWSEFDPYNMVSTEDFKFKDSKGKIWLVPLGTVISTPNPDGYRRAKVLYEVYKYRRTEDREDVLTMYYEALICDGATATKAKWICQVVRLKDTDL